MAYMQLKNARFWVNTPKGYILCLRNKITVWLPSSIKLYDFKDRTSSYAA